MANKTFIAYKYSETQNLRDRIIKALGKDANYYQGETRSSPDLTDTTTDNIKKVLRDMIYGTSVTIVIASPNLKDSKWVDWEIEYSLKEISRADRVSRINGIVAVIMKVNGSYDWLLTRNDKDDGCSVRVIDTSKLYRIINENRFNLLANTYACSHCKTYDQQNGSYISLIEEDSFLADPQKYIDNAYEKSQRIDDFDITKQR